MPADVWHQDDDVFTGNFGFQVGLIFNGVNGGFHAGHIVVAEIEDLIQGHVVGKLGGEIGAAHPGQVGNPRFDAR
jgi:hypothetical protein